MRDHHGVTFTATGGVFDLEAVSLWYIHGDLYGFCFASLAITSRLEVLCRRYDSDDILYDGIWAHRPLTFIHSWHWRDSVLTESWRS